MSKNNVKKRAVILKSATLRRALRLEYPALPATTTEELIERWTGRSFERNTLNRVTHIIVGSYIRHEQTDYDELIRHHKLTKNEARLCINEEVQDGLKAYRVGPPPPRIDEGFITSTQPKWWNKYTKRWRITRRITKIIRRFLTSVIIAK